VDYSVDYFVDLCGGITQSAPPEYLWVWRGGKGAVISFFDLIAFVSFLKV